MNDGTDAELKTYTGTQVTGTTQTPQLRTDSGSCSYLKWRRVVSWLIVRDLNLLFILTDSH